MAERRFSDRDMKAIIQRAAALQAETPTERASGATLDQIQEAAAELGISPEMVARAADEITNNPVERSVSFLGAPTSAEYCRSAEGELHESDIPAVIKEIRRLTGRVGDPKSVGSSLEWVSNQPDGLLVSVSPHNGRTLIDVRANLGNWVGMCVALPFSLSLVLGFAAIGELGIEVGGVMLAAILYTCFLASRYTFARISSGKRQSTLDLADGLEAFLANNSRATQQPIVTEVAPVTKVHQTLIG